MTKPAAGENIIGVTILCMDGFSISVLFKCVNLFYLFFSLNATVYLTFITYFLLDICTNYVTTS